LLLSTISLFGVKAQDDFWGQISREGGREGGREGEMRFMGNEKQ
jgi:hypothetical protein